MARVGDSDHYVACHHPVEVGGLAVTDVGHVLVLAPDVGAVVVDVGGQTARLDRVAREVIATAQDRIAGAASGFWGDLLDTGLTEQVALKAPCAIDVSFFFRVWMAMRPASRASR